MFSCVNATKCHYRTELDDSKWHPMMSCWYDVITIMPDIWIFLFPIFLSIFFESAEQSNNLLILTVSDNYHSLPPEISHISCLSFQVSSTGSSRLY